MNLKLLQHELCVTDKNCLSEERIKNNRRDRKILWVKDINVICPFPRKLISRHLVPNIDINRRNTAEKYFR